MRTLVNPTHLVKPAGAFSHGVAIDFGCATMLFVSSQLPIDSNGQLVSEDPAEQARFIFESINDILAEGGMSLDDIVKLQINMRSIKDFKAVSPVRNEILSSINPATTLVEVGDFLVPGCCLSIDATAMRRGK